MMTIEQVPSAKDNDLVSALTEQVETINAIIAELGKRKHRVDLNTISMFEMNVPGERPVLTVAVYKRIA